MSALSLTHIQNQFTFHLPAVDNAVHYAFRRRLRPQEYEETLAEARVAAWSARHGLIGKGKDPLAVGVTGIANNAVCYVRNGRRVGNTTCGRGRMDPWNWRAQEADGFRVVSLASARREGELKAWIANGQRSTPAENAAFLIDFATWLAGLADRKRQIAEASAEGHELGLVTRLVGVSPARVSQLRTELAENWGEFQDRATPVATVPV